MGASTYIFENLPNIGDIIDDIKVGVYKTKDNFYDINYWIRINDIWIHMPIYDEDLIISIKEKDLSSGEYTLDEFYKKIK